jgi:hypothetical protein
LSKAQYLRNRLAGSGLLAHPASHHFNEFAVRFGGRDAADVFRAIYEESSILAGVPMGRFNPEWKELLLINITERHKRSQLDAVADVLIRHAGGS